MKIEDDLHFLPKEDDLHFFELKTTKLFCEWKMSLFFQKEDDLNILKNGRRPKKNNILTVDTININNPNQP